MEYYVPEGIWYNLLTGENVEGGKWQKETYDYFHMPLLVRANTILAVGSNSDRPDYDYTEGVILYLVNMEDGKEAETVVTDLQGNAVMTVKAERSGNTVYVEVKSGNGSYTCKVLGEELEIIMK